MLYKVQLKQKTYLNNAKYREQRSRRNTYRRKTCVRKGKDESYAAT